jgi:hypothetical protein
MAAFGDDFDLRQFKVAFDTTDDMDAYNRVQAVERGLGRIQNYVSDLSQVGVKLAQPPRVPNVQGSAAHNAFAAMREAGVIDGQLCRRLVRAHDARSMIEHGYIQTPAGSVHQAAKLVHRTSLDFIGRYRPWIEPYLRDTEDKEP